MGTTFTCPNCGWVCEAHPDYGWQRWNEGAVRVHIGRLCPALTLADLVGGDPDA